MVQLKVRLDRGTDLSVGEKFYSNAPILSDFHLFVIRVRRDLIDLFLHPQYLSVPSARRPQTEFSHGVASSWGFDELCLGLRPSDSVSIKNTMWSMDITITFSISIVCSKGLIVGVALYHLESSEVSYIARSILCISLLSIRLLHPTVNCRMSPLTLYEHRRLEIYDNKRHDFVWFYHGIRTGIRAWV